MKKQINIALFLTFLVVVWLFYNTYSQNTIKFEMTTATFGDLTLPFVMNKRTGETWRYFVNNDDKNQLPYGFTPVPYSFGNEISGGTPEIARSHFKT